jgi:hypothetical protein
MRAVDFLLDQAIDRGRGARHQRDAGGRGDEDLQRHHPRRREQHADHRGKDNQRHHARLGQRKKGARAVKPGARGGFTKGIGAQDGPILSAKARRAQQLLQILDHARRIRVAWKAHHQVSEWIDEIDMIGHGILGREVGRRAAPVRRRCPRSRQAPRRAAAQRR